jgi:hypothetical protein
MAEVHPAGILPSDLQVLVIVFLSLVRAMRAGNPSLVTLYLGNCVCNVQISLLLFRFINLDRMI